MNDHFSFELSQAGFIFRNFQKGFSAGTGLGSRRKIVFMSQVPIISTVASQSMMSHAKTTDSEMRKVGE